MLKTITEILVVAITVLGLRELLPVVIPAFGRLILRRKQIRDRAKRMKLDREARIELSMAEELREIRRSLSEEVHRLQSMRGEWEDERFRLHEEMLDLRGQLYQEQREKALCDRQNLDLQSIKTVLEEKVAELSAKLERSGKG